MSFGEKLKELESLGVEIAQRQHRIATLEMEGDSTDLSLRRDLLRAKLELHLAECRHDVLRLELSFAIADRSAGALLDVVDMEDVAP